jgi:hypothetical protein
MSDDSQQDPNAYRTTAFPTDAQPIFRRLILLVLLIIALSVYVYFVLDPPEKPSSSPAPEPTRKIDPNVKLPSGN